MSLIEILMTVWAWTLVLMIILYVCLVPGPDGKTAIDYVRNGIGPRIRW